MLSAPALLFSSHLHALIVQVQFLNTLTHVKGLFVIYFVPSEESRINL